jgi:predicted RND superfamily exporter protein
MKKLSIRQLIPLIKLSKRHKPEVKLIQVMKERAKKDPIVIKMFKEYGEPIEDIDKVEVSFVPLDVSAKTKNKKIYINESMLNDDSDVKDPTHYLVHELTHYLQQTTGKTHGHKEVSDYLDKPTEEEAFKAQIDFKKRNESPEEAEKYTEDLLDHHDLSGRERQKKKEKLLDKES